MNLYLFHNEGIVFFSVDEYNNSIMEEFEIGVRTYYIGYQPINVYYPIKLYSHFMRLIQNNLLMSSNSYDYSFLTLLLDYLGYGIHKSDNYTHRIISLHANRYVTKYVTDEFSIELIEYLTPKYVHTISFEQFYSVDFSKYFDSIKLKDIISRKTSLNEQHLFNCVYLIRLFFNESLDRNSFKRLQRLLIEKKTDLAIRHFQNYISNPNSKTINNLRR